MTSAPRPSLRPFWVMIGVEAAVGIPLVSLSYVFAFTMDARQFRDPKIMNATILLALVFITFFFVVQLWAALRQRTLFMQAQGLAPAAFVFRFIQLSDFRGVLAQLPTSWLRHEPPDRGRSGAASVDATGVTIWSLDTRRALAALPWAAVTRVDAVPFTIAGRTYYAVLISVEVNGDVVAVPFASACTKLQFSRRAMPQSFAVADKVNRLRVAAASSTPMT